MKHLRHAVYSGCFAGFAFTPLFLFGCELLHQVVNRPWDEILIKVSICSLAGLLIWCALFVGVEVVRVRIVVGTLAVLLACYSLWLLFFTPF